MKRLAISIAEPEKGTREESGLIWANWATPDGRAATYDRLGEVVPKGKDERAG